MMRALFPASASLKAIAAVAAIGVACANSANAQTDVPDPTTQITQSGYSPVYLGVDTETATVPSNPATTGGKPTISRATVMRIDLRAPGVSVETTSHSGPLMTTSETISQFAARTGVRLAINANFFAPCCATTPEPKSIIGLLVSHGQVVSPLTSDPTQSEAVLAITRQGRAYISEAPQISPQDLKLIDTAVSGSAILLKNGQDISAQSPNEGDPLNPNPRTLVGLSQQGRFLYFVVIDGRIAGYSTGTTNAQSAQLMKAIGADDAINLDGGGSTELVRADRTGVPFIVDTPSGGAERLDASAIGVHALKLPQLPGFPF
ncbi:MAG TPA: phosphodiester glycosidase family protein [Paraburkholderia sp.]